MSARTAAHRDLVEQELSRQLISDIRDAVNTGLALGNERFREELEQLMEGSQPDDRLDQSSN